MLLFLIKIKLAMTSTATTTIYYTDSTAPSALLGSMSVGVGPYGTATQNRVEYSLYDDSATWTAWSAWAA